jgi:glycerophosphoryl diester phosphodiesterase
MMVADPFYLPDRPLIIAHRGARGDAPENTLAAFRMAIDMGADGIECDVDACATGQIVIMHDSSVDRTTDGAGRVHQMALSALRALDAGAWFGPSFAGERVPLLEELLDLARGRARVNIEIKSVDARARGVELAVACLVRERHMEDEVIISSFNPLVLARMRRVAPELRRGLLYSRGLPFPLRRVWARRWVGASALHPHLGLVHERYVTRAAQQGYRVNVWTVNAREQMRAMINAGVDAIITDYPARLRALLDGSA